MIQNKLDAIMYNVAQISLSVLPSLCFFHIKNNPSVVRSSCVHYLNKSPLTTSEEYRPPCGCGLFFFIFKAPSPQEWEPHWDAVVDRPAVSLMARLSELTRVRVGSFVAHFSCSF